MYKTGSMEAAADCKMAPDSKSVMLQQPQSSQQMALKILKPGDDNLVIASAVLNGDTMVLNARGGEKIV
jgi:hypothetical protein